jgi:hypothetical protein
LDDKCVFVRHVSIMIFMNEMEFRNEYFILLKLVLYIFGLDSGSANGWYRPKWVCFGVVGFGFGLEDLYTIHRFEMTKEPLMPALT